MVEQNLIEVSAVVLENESHLSTCQAPGKYMKVCPRRYG